MAAYRQARHAVQKAQERGETIESIAALCGVSTGSVRRWYETGRADANAIAPLLDKIGRVYPSAEEIADDLIEFYKHRGRKPFRLYRRAWQRVTQRRWLKGAFNESLVETLFERGYHLLLEEDSEGREMRLFLSRKDLRVLAKEAPSEDDLREFFGRDVPEVDEDE